MTAPGRATSPQARTRRPLAWVLLALALGGCLFIGALGMARAVGGTASTRVPIGTFTDLPGGQIRVDAVEPVPAMSGRMNGPAMNMGAMKLPDPLPEGQHRIRVDVTVAADRDGDGVAARAHDFVLRGVRIGRLTPHSAVLGRGRVPAGMATHASLTFQIPDTARNLELTLPGKATVKLPGRAVVAGGHAHHHG